jgi:2-oxoglutarate ferredoxin oxidoreductase subunit beta
LKKLEEDYDPTNRVTAVKRLMDSHEKGEALTGVFFVDTQKSSFTDLLNLSDEPLALLRQEQIRPGKEVLDKVMESLT